MKRFTLTKVSIALISLVATIIVFSASHHLAEAAAEDQIETQKTTGTDVAPGQDPTTLLERAWRLHQKALELLDQGHFDQAAPFAEEALIFREQASGPINLDVAASLNTLGLVLHQQVKLREARQYLKRALDIRESIRGPFHPDVAESLINLARVMYADGDFAGARPLLERALDIRKNVLGEVHPDVAVTLTHLGIVQSQLGDLSGAQRNLETAAVILEQTENSHRIDLAMTLNRLGHVRSRIGDFAGARGPLERSLQIREELLGPRHPHVARSLTFLADLVEKMGDTERALALAERALAINEQTLGSMHGEVAGSLNDVARLRYRRGDLNEAQRLFERALRLQEQAVGPKHPFVAITLTGLAQVRQQAGAIDEARTLFDRALHVQEESVGRDHPFLANTFTSLAYLEGQTRNFSRAQSLLTQALEIREKTLGPTHPDVALSLNDLARALHAQGNLTAARPLYERARQIYLAMGHLNENLDDEALSHVWRLGLKGLHDYASLLAGIAQHSATDRNSVSAKHDAFIVAEQSRIGVAHVALARAAARVSTGDPATAELARRMQDLRNRRQEINSILITEYSKAVGERDVNEIEKLRALSRQLELDLIRTVNQLNAAYPKYAELTSPEPIDVPGVRKMLGADEALISYWIVDDRLLIWLVRRDQELTYQDLRVNRDNLRNVVNRVRATLDQSENLVLARVQPVAFDVAGANQLYKALFEPIQDQLKGVNHLIIIPDAMLLPLPFGTLIAESTGGPYKRLSELHKNSLRPSRDDLAIYQSLSWLVKQYSITVLPSASSLRALRQLSRSRERRRQPFIGFGDPVLDGAGNERGGKMIETRGPTFSLHDIRKLSRLPGTREELTAIARTLGADPEKALYLGEQATEFTIRRLNDSGELRKTEVIAFATHGLLAGQIAGLKQPALVLTPPEKPSDDDNGLLDLDEILGLKLDSTDWAILSACNTGAVDGSGEGLSGLVRAFFFSGAQSILVSHWSVDDSATQALMAAVFRHYARNRNVPRAEALRQGMLAVMGAAERENAYFGHPFAWAPFFLVGEGSVGKR